MVQSAVTSYADSRVADPDRLVPQCVAALGPELTAYLAGAHSRAQFDAWLAGADESTRSRMVRRLSAAAQIVRIFSTENLVSLVGPWFREIGLEGEPAPARTIRNFGDNNDVVKGLLESAAFWIGERHRTHQYPGRIAPIGSW